MRASASAEAPLSRSSARRISAASEWKRKVRSPPSLRAQSSALRALAHEELRSGRLVGEARDPERQREAARQRRVGAQGGPEALTHAHGIDARDLREDARQLVVADAADHVHAPHSGREVARESLGGGVRGADASARAHLRHVVQLQPDQAQDGPRAKGALALLVDAAVEVARVEQARERVDRSVAPHLLLQDRRDEGRGEVAGELHEGGGGILGELLPVVAEHHQESEPRSLSHRHDGRAPEAPHAHGVVERELPHPRPAGRDPGPQILWDQRDHLGLRAHRCRRRPPPRGGRTPPPPAPRPGPPPAPGPRPGRRSPRRSGRPSRAACSPRPSGDGRGAARRPGRGAGPRSPACARSGRRRCAGPRARTGRRPVPRPRCAPGGRRGRAGRRSSGARTAGRSPPPRAAPGPGHRRGRRAGRRGHPSRAGRRRASARPGGPAAARRTAARRSRPGARR